MEGPVRPGGGTNNIRIILPITPIRYATSVLWVVSFSSFAKPDIPLTFNAAKNRAMFKIIRAEVNMKDRKPKFANTAKYAIHPANRIAHEAINLFISMFFIWYKYRSKT